MKRLLIILTLAHLAQHLTAQVEWAPIGAEWYYTEPYQKELNYIQIESVGDTTIKEQNCKTLLITRNGHEFISREYIAQLGDTILYYNPQTDCFHTLYNFSAQIGDTVHVHTQPFRPTDAFLLPFSFLEDGIIPYFSYCIVRIDSIEISGVWMKQQEVDFITNDDQWGFSNITGGEFLIEGIGSLTYFFGRGNWIVLNEQVTLLRCYNDENNVFQNPQWGSSCTLISSLKFPESKKHRIYPNPTNDILHLEFNDEQEVRIQVVDDIGRIRMAEQISLPSQLNISHLESGFYILRIISKKKYSTHKILKK